MPAPNLFLVLACIALPKTHIAFVNVAGRKFAGSLVCKPWCLHSISLTTPSNNFNPSPPRSPRVQRGCCHA